MTASYEKKMKAKPNKNEKTSYRANIRLLKHSYFKKKKKESFISTGLFSLKFQKMWDL